MFALGLTTVIGTTAALADALTLDVIIRDFRARGLSGPPVPGHPDFQYTIVDDLGIVKTDLGVDGKPVYASPGVTPTTNGAAYFDQWYRDVAGVNIRIDTTLTADPISGGRYQFTSNSYFPIDGQGFGNDGNSHNYHFTTEINTQFTFTGEGTFTFSGDDDVWVFVNGKLALDLGGVHTTRTGSFDLATEAANLGLSVGGVYGLSIFHAERHTVDSNFTFTTSLVLEPATTETPLPAALPLFAGGLGMLGMLARRRQKAKQNA